MTDPHARKDALTEGGAHASRVEPSSFALPLEKPSEEARDWLRKEGGREGGGRVRQWLP